MDPDGTSPWYTIIMMFAYAGAGWAVFAAVFLWMRRARRAPVTAKQAATGYGESWQTNSQADL